MYVHLPCNAAALQHSFSCSISRQLQLMMLQRGAVNHEHNVTFRFGDVT